MTKKTRKPPPNRPKRRPRRLTALVLGQLGRKGESLGDVAGKAGLTEGRLAKEMARKPTWRAAWQRGRLLHDVGRLSRLAASQTAAATALGMDGPAFRQLLAEDPQVAETWRQGRLQTYQAIMAATLKQVHAGNATAGIQLLKELRDDAPGMVAKPDFYALPVEWVAEAISRSRQLIYRWTAEKGAPKNVDGTISLPALWAWREEYLKKLHGAGATGNADEQLKRARHEQIVLANRRQRGELLDRTAVIAGICTRAQTLVAAMNSRPARLSVVLAGRPADEIAEVLAAEFRDLRGMLAELPAELRLPPEAAEHFRKMMKALQNGQETHGHPAEDDQNTPPPAADAAGATQPRRRPGA